MNARESRFRIFPVIFLCLALLGTAATFAAQLDKSASSGSLIVIHNPNAIPGAAGARRPFSRLGTATTDSCYGVCDCYSCSCSGTLGCCVDGCFACFDVACNAT